MKRPTLLLFTWIVGFPLPADAHQRHPTAERVGPGVLSTPAVEHNAAFTPDGRTLYFTRNDAAWGAGGRSTIYVSRLEDEAWTEPVVAPFSGTHSDSDAFVTPDGRQLYFVSTRPGTEGGGRRDIWVVSLGGGQPAEPRLVSGDVNTPGDEYSPVVAASGRLYFASTRPGGMGRGDLYSAPPEGDGFGLASNLGRSVNSPFGEWNLVVDPDERLLIFEASGRALNRTLPGDLYISFRSDDGWSPSVPVTALNTPGSDLMPRLSPDGRRLYFASQTTVASDHTDLFVAELGPIVERARETARPLLAAVSRSAHHLAVIDPQSLEIVRRIETAPGPHEVAALPRGRAVTAEYGIFPTPHEQPVTSHPGFAPDHERGNTLRVVDALGSFRRTIELPGCTRSHGVHASADGRLVWATCEPEGMVVEVEPETRVVARRWETGSTNSHRLLSTHADRYLTVANVQDGSVTIVDRATGETRALETGEGSEGLAATSDGYVWVLASADRSLTLVDPEAAAVVRSFPTGGQFPISVSLDEARGEAWVAHMGPRAVDVLDLETGERIARVPFDTGPLRVLVVPESRHVYVSLPRENAIAVVDRASRQVVARIEDIMEVDGLAWIRPTR